MGKHIPNRDSSRDYVNNDELRQEIAICKERGELSEKLSAMFLKICTKLSGAFIYDNNEDRHDCVMEAYIQLSRKYVKIDLSKNTNAFSYCTQIALNGLRAGWNKLAKSRKDTISINHIFDDSI